MIKEILPNTKPRISIIRGIYENPGINITTLIEISGSSPNTVIKYVNSLADNNIIIDDKIGGKKKVHIRRLRINFSNNLASKIITFIEAEKRSDFLKRFNNLRPFFSQIKDLLEEKSEFSLVYGSFAKLSPSKDSDLDIFIAGKVSKTEKKRVTEIFSTLDREFSIKIETIEKFKKSKSDPLHQNIIRDHVLFFGEEGYLRAVFEK